MSVSAKIKKSAMQEKCQMLPLLYIPSNHALTDNSLSPQFKINVVPPLINLSLSVTTLENKFIP